jgi:hypothetical protein
VTNHAHIFGRPRGAYFYAQIMAEAVKSGAWITTRAQMAEHVLAHYAPHYAVSVYLTDAQVFRAQKY